MKCPFCNYVDSKVIDSRSADDGSRIRRRRECLQCGGRFTTYEVVENLPLLVIKKDKSRQPFDKEKLLNRLLLACKKRPIPVETLERVVSEIEMTLLNSFVREVESTQIGEMALDKLRDIDVIAYVRFAPVYRDFSTVDEFMNELKNLKKS